MNNPNDSAAFIGIILFAATTYLVCCGKKKAACCILFLFLPILLILSSRTMVAFAILNLFLILISRSKVKKISMIKEIIESILFAAIFSILMLALWYLIQDLEFETIGRASERLKSFLGGSSDESIDFRFVSHYRLFESFGMLGFGSLSDLNYHDFFQSNDPLLMKVNPHSYLVEYSFLFGYLGFIIIFLFFIIIMYKLLINKKLPFSFKLLACFGLLFTQAVPASLLVSFYFFVPFIFIFKIK
jgi:oligosaccharide repeat unit polymerase